MEMTELNSATNSVGQSQLDQNGSNDILNAARNIDILLLEKLLQKKKSVVQRPLLYPRDWEYTFEHLQDSKDIDGRTALHLVASAGNHENALQCMKLILQSPQILCHDEHGTAKEKTRMLLEIRDKDNETALHIAIENKAAEIVSCLLSYNANTLARNKNGVGALELIYQRVPDALREQFDNCVKLNKDYRSVTIDWGPVVHLHVVKSKQCELWSFDEGRQNKNNDDIPKSKENVTSGINKNETKCLSFLLRSDKMGETLYLHPIVKLFLELKWKKVQVYFWIPFILQLLWLLFYAVIFVNLHLEIAELKAGSNETQNQRCSSLNELIVDNSTNSSTNTPVQDCAGIELNGIWHSVLLFAVIILAKEVYQALVFRRAYFTLENVVQVLFLILVISQYVLLMYKVPGYIDIIASISPVAIILGTMQAIFHLGKTPTFGMQVAAFEKVILSCMPHLPVFIVWFIGFSLAFWAMVYNAEKSWMVSILPLVVAMGIGELNAKEYLEEVKTESSLSQIMRAFCFIVFVIVIVTLYFNLLIGYAVSDIQVLKSKAEMLELSIRLRTVYFMETFLHSIFGKFVVFLKWSLQKCLGSCIKKWAPQDGESYLDSIYVVTNFNRCRGKQMFKFDDLDPKMALALKELGMKNVVKKTNDIDRWVQRMTIYLELSESERESLVDCLKTGSK